MGEFWDTHDFTDFDTDAPDVEFTIACAVPVEADLLVQVEQQARLRGVKVETLVNLWLQQKLAELTPPAAKPSRKRKGAPLPATQPVSRSAST